MGALGAATHLGARRGAEGKGATPASRMGSREQASGSHTWSRASRSSGDRPKVILRARIAAVLFRPAWRVPPVLSSEARSKAQGRAARSLGRGGQAGARPSTHEKGRALVQVLAHRMRENVPRSASGGRRHNGGAGQDPAIIEQSHGNEVSAVTIEHGRGHTTTHTSCPQCIQCAPCPRVS